MATDPLLLPDLSFGSHIDKLTSKLLYVLPPPDQDALILSLNTLSIAGLKRPPNIPPIKPLPRYNYGKANAKMVGAVGFEPTTSASRTLRAKPGCATLRKTS